MTPSSIASKAEEDSAISQVLPLVTQVSQTLPEDELQNLINDLKKKRNEYLGEQVADKSVRDKLASKIEPGPPEERGRQMEAPQPVRIRSLSKPAIPKSKEQKKADLRRAMMKDFARDLPSLANLFLSFLGIENQ